MNDSCWCRQCSQRQRTRALQVGSIADPTCCLAPSTDVASLDMSSAFPSSFFYFQPRKALLLHPSSTIDVSQLTARARSLGAPEELLLSVKILWRNLSRHSSKNVIQPRKLFRNARQQKHIENILLLLFLIFYHHFGTHTLLRVQLSLLHHLDNTSEVWFSSLATSCGASNDII